MFFSMQLLCFYKQPPPSLFASLSRQLVFKDTRLIKNPSFSSCIVYSVKEDSDKQYEVDPEKAREALKELDQQIQSLSNKQVSSPKVTGTLSFCLLSLSFMTFHSQLVTKLANSSSHFKIWVITITIYYLCKNYIY